MKIKINGKEVDCSPDATVLEAAKASGTYIPSLCFHPKTGMAGKCRVCVVEVEGMRGLQTSCTVKVQEGMSINTRSDSILAAQKMVVELLLASGQHDCLSCQRSGNCELQDAAYYLGIERPSFHYADTHYQVPDRSAPFVYLDKNKCISCGRCVAACNNVVVNEVLDFAYRGHHAEIICDADVPMGESSCVQCGECSQICPVGAIVDAKSIGKARPWDTKLVRTTCPYCGVGCQLNLHVQGEQIVKVTGVEGAKPNNGMLCVKGRYAYDFMYSEDRLTKPLIKEKNGVFREASWDEALKLIASKFKESIDQYGPDSVAGVSCARSINEDSYNMQKLFRSVFKTNNIDHCART
ncbi:MAG: putative formate dehydrogenase [Betaproteobacteria bacterium ADurb.Bin341]|nr:MAG: putative formate dehydrogenase [Betaproteobacteria bacterium ADurb.Bin341]